MANVERLKEMAATEAWKTVQDAVEILYDSEDFGPDAKKKAIDKLQIANEWLNALKK